MKRTPSIIRVVAVIALLTATAACGQKAEPPAETDTQTTAQSGQEEGMVLSSAAFGHGEPIPVQYTADGADMSPPLLVSGVPEGTASLALIMDDPDAPAGTWYHWVVWNIPAEVQELAEGTPPEGASEGTNSWDRSGYGGPSPPSGTHRYFVRLYALDQKLELTRPVDAETLESAMLGHVLARAELMGIYTRD